MRLPGARWLECPLNFLCSPFSNSRCTPHRCCIRRRSSAPYYKVYFGDYGLACSEEYDGPLKFRFLSYVTSFHVNLGLPQQIFHLRCHAKHQLQQKSIVCYLENCTLDTVVAKLSRQSGLIMQPLSLSLDQMWHDARQMI